MTDWSQGRGERVDNVEWPYDQVEGTGYYGCGVFRVSFLIMSASLYPTFMMFRMFSVPLQRVFHIFFTVMASGRLIDG